MKCKNCNKEHDSSYGSGIFCSKRCQLGYAYKTNKKEINKKMSKTKTYSRTLVEKKCKKCGSIFNVERKINKEGTQLIPKKEVSFCSRKCANTRKHTEETKNKISIKCSKRLGNRKTVESKICKLCGKSYKPTRNVQKYCSKVCSVTVWQRASNLTYRKDELPIKNHLEYITKMQFNKEYLHGHFYDFTNKRYVIEHTNDIGKGITQAIDRLNKITDSRVKILICNDRLLGSKRKNRMNNIRLLNIKEFNEGTFI